MTEATLIRLGMRFERNFTQIPNSYMRDNRLSFRTRGLLGFLMSQKPGKFTVTLKALANDNPEGIDAIRASVEELEKYGYLMRYRKARGGQFQPDTWALTDPHEQQEPLRFTASDNPTRSGSASDNPTRTASDKPTPIRTLEEDSSVNEVPSLPSGRSCANGHPEVVETPGYCKYGDSIRTLQAVTS